MMGQKLKIKATLHPNKIAENLNQSEMSFNKVHDKL
jgi:hypothetical protein